MYRTIRSAVLFLFVALSAMAQGPTTCVVCRKVIQEAFYLISTPAVAEKQPVCKACAQLESICFSCGMPVKANFTKLVDGRLLCEADAKAAIFEQSEALRIFEETRKDVGGILSIGGTLPSGNLTVRLVDGVQLDILHKQSNARHGRGSVVGLTQSRLLDQNRAEHSIYLINGLGRNRLAAVCAHEYTHAWLNENLPADRRLDSDVVEGFCELVAYKLMSQRNQPQEKKVILENVYARRPLETLLKAEEQYQFFRVLDWIKNGQDERLDRAALPRLLALNGPPAQPFGYLPQTQTPVPETLVLKGISGTAKRRFALINDSTLAQNEQAKVRVGATNLIVRCLEITDQSVVIQVQGHEKTTLTLNPAKTAKELARANDGS